jgi:hypothetical protein
MSFDYEGYTLDDGRAGFYGRPWDNWQTPRRNSSAQQQHEDHAGKGPKNYKRSDELVCDEICERLTRHPAIDAREIEVDVKQGEVTLSGSVDSRHNKRLAETLTEDVFGVREIHNHLRVSQDMGEHSGFSEGLQYRW